MMMKITVDKFSNNADEVYNIDFLKYLSAAYLYNEFQPFLCELSVFVIRPKWTGPAIVSELALFHIEQKQQ